MKISLTAYDEFLAYHGRATKEVDGYNHLRFGQAWYNYFKLQAHTQTEAERVALDRIYNETDTLKAMQAIRNNFIDASN